MPKKFGLYEARAAICPTRQGMQVSITMLPANGIKAKKPRPDGQQLLQHPHKSSDHLPVNGEPSSFPFDVVVVVTVVVISEAEALIFSDCVVGRSGENRKS